MFRTTRYTGRGQRTNGTNECAPALSHTATAWLVLTVASSTGAAVICPREKNEVCRKTWTQGTKAPPRKAQVHACSVFVDQPKTAPAGWHKKKKLQFQENPRNQRSPPSLVGAWTITFTPRFRVHLEQRNDETGHVPLVTHGRSDLKADRSSPTLFSSSATWSTAAGCPAWVPETKRGRGLRVESGGSGKRREVQHGQRLNVSRGAHDTG